MIADDREIDFYRYFDINPVGKLSNCQYDNELRLGVEFGDDLCSNLKDEDQKNACNNCPKHEQIELYYPPITDDVIINLILLVGVDDLNLDTYATAADKYVILDYIKRFKKSAYSLIKEILIGHLQEWNRT